MDFLVQSVYSSCWLTRSEAEDAVWNGKECANSVYMKEGVEIARSGFSVVGNALKNSNEFSRTRIFCARILDDVYPASLDLGMRKNGLFGVPLLKS